MRAVIAFLARQHGTHVIEGMAMNQELRSRGEGESNDAGREDFANTLRSVWCERQRYGTGSLSCEPKVRVFSYGPNMLT